MIAQGLETTETEEKPVISQKVVTWEVAVWFYHSSPLLACKEKPRQHPYFQSFPPHPWHRNVRCSQPSAALPASQPGVMGGSKSPKHTTCQKGKACGTARSSCKPDSWTPECSSGTSNNLVGFWGEIVERCLSSASKALNYDASSIVKTGKNKSNPNVGSAPLNYQRTSKQHMAGPGGRDCMVFSFLKNFF